jgi:hypothetical protein
MRLNAAVIKASTRQIGKIQKNNGIQIQNRALDELSWLSMKTTPGKRAIFIDLIQPTEALEISTPAE